MIIGLTGSMAAGKGTIADFLIQRGFQHYSVEYFLIQELKKRGMIVNKDNLNGVYKEMQVENGKEYVIDTLYELAKKTGKDSVIESLNCVEEIELLKLKQNCFIVALDAAAHIRYERAMNKESEAGMMSLDEFLEAEDREKVMECVKLADFAIINEGTIAELKVKLSEAIEKFEGKEKRPSWDEYFMEICKAVAKRATCDRGKSGCVIVKDKRLLVTGYVGSPKGIPHCDEVGHQMKTIVHEDGTRTQHCVRTTHAEQNAICQAAMVGIPIDGGILYCKMTPCSTCAKMIINAGIKKVICEKKYHAGKESEELFSQARIEIEFLEDTIEQYKNQ